MFYIRAIAPVANLYLPAKLRVLAEVREHGRAAGQLEDLETTCASCHAPSGNGNAPAGFPDVGGQPNAYTVNQLTAYREGERATDEVYGGMMRGVASRLTDTEIEALAAYLRGLH